MIINFSVKNFGPIKEQITLSFEATNSDELEDYYVVKPKKGLRLLKLGLIYGANASGKTTVLQALDFLRNMVLHPFETKNRQFKFSPFLFDENTPLENSAFELEFIQNAVKYLYKLTFNKAAVVREKLYFYNPNKALVYERKTIADRQLSIINFGSKIKIGKEHKAVLEGNTLWNNTVLGGYLKTNLASEQLQNAVDWFYQLKDFIRPDTDLFGRITVGIENQHVDKNLLLQFLRKADFKISDVIVKKEKVATFNRNRKIIPQDLPPYNKQAAIYIPDNSGNYNTRLEILFQHTLANKNTYTLPFDAESQGTQRYFGFSGILALMMQKPSIFLVDELESSLHPDLLKHFLLSFLVNTQNAQLIATTHLRELLMERDIFRNDAIWFTEKQADGSTDLFSLADFDTSVVRDTSSIYNAYKIGKLGAVPNLQDYYNDLTDGTD